MIKSEIVAHSLSPQGNELISVLCTFPRIILAEVNTHRMLSKNTSSSRAIPFNKMVQAIDANAFVPIAWQKEHSGMQGTEYHTDWYIIKELESMWEDAKNAALESAKTIGNEGVTKQICNRLLEPFMWTTMLITGSREGWDNFFHLRCPSYLHEGSGTIYKSKKDFKNREWEDFSHLDKASDTDLEWLKANKGQAEIHMIALAEAIWDSVNESTPKQLRAGDWHIPFEDKIKLSPTFHKNVFLRADSFILNESGLRVGDLVTVVKDDARFYIIINDIQKDVVMFTPFEKNKFKSGYYDILLTGREFLTNEEIVQISTAMSARTSYTMIGEEKSLDLDKMISLHDRLINQTPPHSSPLEHCAKAMNDDEHFEFRRGKLFEDTDTGLLMPADNDSAGWCFNLKGFISYRYIIDKQYK